MASRDFMIVDPTATDDELMLTESLRLRDLRRFKMAAGVAAAAAVGLVGGAATLWPNSVVHVRGAIMSVNEVLVSEESKKAITDADEVSKVSVNRACLEIPGVKLAESKTKSPWPSCSAKWSEDCTNTGCCQDWGMKCFKKGEGWASCRDKCEPKDENNETWSCDVLWPPAPRTSDGCVEACKKDPKCAQAIFNSDGGGSCTLSQVPLTDVVWAGDNFNATFCADSSKAATLAELEKKVRAQLPFVQPPWPLVTCSWAGEDCSKTKCCNDVKCDGQFTNCYGYSCYAKSEYFAGCRAETPPADWNGTWIGGPREHRTIWPASKEVAVSGTTLYCFMVISWDAPRPKPFWSTEAELADNIKKHGVGIMQCDAHDIYDGVQTQKAEWGSFSNIDAFQKIWQGVKDKGTWKNYDWTVKVDADAVFFPQRLKQHLEKLRTPAGARVYIENTWFQFRFMGALEVLSKGAVERFLEMGHACIRGEHAGGEDFFMKGCMDAIGVDHQEDHALLKDKYAKQDEPCTDGWAVAYHFHKKIISWNWCYNEAVCGNRGKTCDAGLEVEYVLPWQPPAAR